MKKENYGFECIGCGKTIEPAMKTSRNHCPYCFLSQHVDGVMPGDRESECGAEMIPVEYFIANGSVKIHFICVKCGKSHNNKAASDDDMGNIDRSIKKRKKKHKNIIL